MRHVASPLLVALVGSALGLALVACEPPPPVHITPPSARMVLVDDDDVSICNDEGACFVDFGGVVSGDVVVRSFFIENACGGPLELPRYAFAGGGDAGFALVDELPRSIPAGDRAEVVVEFTAGATGLIGGSLLIDDGDDDDDGDVGVFLRANVVECGERSARVRIVAVNGVNVDDDDEAPVVLVGDQLVLAAEIELCDEPPPASVQWRLLAAPAGFLTFTDDRALLRVDDAGDFQVQATLIADDGTTLATPELQFAARSAVDIQFLLVGGGALHVARDSLGWCSDDDCFDGHCDVAWGLRGGAPVVSDDGASSGVLLVNAGDGVYTAAASVDDESAVFVRMFVDGNIALEVTRQLRPGEPRLIGRISVEDGVATALDVDDTSPQPGLCF